MRVANAEMLDFLADDDLSFTECSRVLYEVYRYRVYDSII